ncbi:MAG: magnesium/cobalt transporter CorA [Bacteroidales bacterium]
MIRIYCKNENTLIKIQDVEEIDNYSEIIWIDLLLPSMEEVDAIEEKYGITFLSRQKQIEIESSSRYIETNNYIIANSNFIYPIESIYISNPVSFVLKGAILFTYREADLKNFAETVKRIKTEHDYFINGTQILVFIFENRIDYEADLIEQNSRDINSLNKEIGFRRVTDEKYLLKISELQEITMQLRESIIDKQRVISSMLKSIKFKDDDLNRLRILIKDIGSMLGHIDFNFERLEYMQNTFLGLVNIEQNKIIKIFTVASLIFMPPTLIASIYGMNFKFMPELEWVMGYPFAIAIMIASSALAIYIFKRNRWL